ncbi:MAG: penicillin-binding transpeptidase domain-containing protein [Desulfonauticus sp.]|nr:penicillin-binding transpeptidase domain-containing protein [Desulfonauticus sp.]
MIYRRTRNSTLGKARFWIFTIFLLLIWGGLLARTFWIQLIWGPKLVARACSQYFVASKLQGLRGKILDRNGVVLAQTISAYSVFARPLEVENSSKVARVLSIILSEPYAKILAKLKNDKKFVWIRRKISDLKAEKIKSSRLHGIYLTREFTRIYPQGHLLGQVLGFTNIDGKGLEGLERSFDSYLKGKREKFVAFKDAKGRIIRFNLKATQKDLNGKDLILTIDTRLQAQAEDILAKTVQKFRGKNGILIIAKVKNGEILALANYPFFNPNSFFAYSPLEMRNRAALDLFEPGSTAKPFMVAAALEQGICQPDTIFFCEQGKWRLESKTIRDTHKYGWLSVSAIVRYSSNIGIGKIALKVGPKTFFQVLKRFGFTQKVPLPLPGRVESLIRPPKKWTKIDLVSAGFGQGWATTGLHLVQAYVSLANGGVFTPLVLVKHPELTKPESKQILSPTISKQILRMLWEVVNRDGTGKKLKLKDISLGGKTGTAQKSDLIKGGYKQGAYVASFVGVFPALSPKYVVFLAVDEPQTEHYGAEVAGPGVRQMVLNIAAMDKTVFRKSKAQTPVSRHRYLVQNDLAQLSDLNRLSDFRGKSLRYALDVLNSKQVQTILKGKGVIVVGQKPAPGTILKKHMKVHLYLGFPEEVL